MLFSTNSAIALSGLLCESAMMRMAFQSSPILSLPPSAGLLGWTECESGIKGRKTLSVDEERAPGAPAEWVSERTGAGADSSIVGAADRAHEALRESTAFWLVAYPSQGREMLFGVHTSCPCPTPRGRCRSRGRRGSARTSRRSAR